MCYFLGVEERVGVRELRQNLSKHLRRVVSGERLVVTERGRPVAFLVPIPDIDDPLERMIAEGKATRGMGGLLDVPSVEGPVSDLASRWLLESREDRA